MREASSVPACLPPAFQSPAARDRIAAVAESYHSLTGRELVAGGSDVVGAMWASDSVILAHGTGADPLFFFANRTGVAAFETTIEEILMMPSRLSAEPGLREERARLLARVTAEGFIDDYSGVRISATGRRFRIERATVWNVHDCNGQKVGQAATFVAPAHAIPVA